METMAFRSRSAVVPMALVGATGPWLHTINGAATLMGNTGINLICFGGMIGEAAGTAMEQISGGDTAATAISAYVCSVGSSNICCMGAGAASTTGRHKWMLRHCW
jgi:hypothetical protein